MLWELSMICPINYFEGGPFEISKRYIDNADEFRPPIVNDFRIFVDGLELKRPQLFPSTCAWIENYTGRLM